MLDPRCEAASESGFESIRQLVEQFGDPGSRTQQRVDRDHEAGAASPAAYLDAPGDTGGRVQVRGEELIRPECHDQVGRLDQRHPRHDHPRFVALPVASVAHGTQVTVPDHQRADGAGESLGEVGVCRIVRGVQGDAADEHRTLRRNGPGQRVRTGGDHGSAGIGGHGVGECSVGECNVGRDCVLQGSGAGVTGGGDLLGTVGDVPQSAPGEQVTGLDADTALAQASGDGQCTDAVASEADEVGLNIHGVHGARGAVVTEQFGHHLGQQLLGRGEILARFSVVIGGGAVGTGLAWLVLVDQGVQGPTVDLAADGERQPVVDPHHRRHQMGRNVGGQRLAHVDGGLPGGCLGGQGDMGDQLHRASRPERPHRSPGDLRQGEQARLDLAGFHPVATDLQLVVGSSEELGGGDVGTPAHPVTGAVAAPGAGGPGIRCGPSVRNGLERRGVRTPPVPQCDLRAGQQQLTDLVGRHDLTVDVEDLGGHTRHRAPDRHRTRHDAGRESVDGGLGRAVDIPRVDPVTGRQAVPQRLRHGLAAEDQGRYVGGVERPGVDQRPGQRRGGVQDVHPVTYERGAHQLRVADGPVGIHVYHSTREYPGQLVYGGVEGEGRGVGDVQRCVLGCHRRSRHGRRGVQLLGVTGQQCLHAGAGDLHTLRRAGGAGGVEQVRQFSVGTLRVRRGCFGGCISRGDPVLGEDGDRAGIGEDVLASGLRVLPVEDHERPVRTPGGQYRHRQVHTLGQVQGNDAVFRAGFRDVGGAVRDLAGQLFGLQHGRVVGDATGHRVDQLVQPGHGVRHRCTGTLGGPGGQGRVIAQPDLRHRPLGEQQCADVLEPLGGGGGVHAGGVGLEGEVDGLAGTSCGRGDHQDEVLGRAAGDIAQHPGGALEVEGEVEGLQVHPDAVQDRRTVEPHLGVAGEVADQVAAGVALVRPDLLEGGACGIGDLRDCGTGGQREAQRHHVDLHRRGAAQRAGGAGHHRHRDEGLGVGLSLRVDRVLPGDTELAQPGTVGAEDHVRPHQTVRLRAGT